MTDTPIERLRLLADFLNGPHPAVVVSLNHVYREFPSFRQFGDDLREVTGREHLPSRDDIARALYERWSNREKAKADLTGISSVYAGDHFQNLPASFTKTFFEDADAILGLRK